MKREREEGLQEFPIISNPEIVWELEDNDRLVHLGSTALELAITHYLFEKKPLLTATEMQVECEELSCDQKVATWAEKYPTMTQLQNGPPRELEDSEEKAASFRAYIGGLYLDTNMKMIDIQPWVEQLIEGKEAVGRKKIKLDTEETWVGVKREASNSLLMKFNEAIQKRKFTVHWESVHAGMPHDGIWTVDCFVNGVVAGRGCAKTVKSAKEAAASDAYLGMGWV